MKDSNNNEDSNNNNGLRRVVRTVTVDEKNSSKNETNNNSDVSVIPQSTISTEKNHSIHRTYAFHPHISYDGESIENSAANYQAYQNFVVTMRGENLNLDNSNT